MDRLTPIHKAPAWEAVRYVKKRFKREELFHMEDETSAELDAAWKNLTGRESPSGNFLPSWGGISDELITTIASAGHVRLPLDEAKRNVPTLELYYDPGYYLYGVSVFHQMHCLVSPDGLLSIDGLVCLMFHPLSGIGCPSKVLLWVRLQSPAVTDTLSRLLICCD